MVRGEEIWSERLPGEHRWKCRWSFGYCALPQRTLPVELLACWRRHSQLNDFHFHRVRSERVEFTSGILPVDSSGVQRVPTGKVGLKGVLVNQNLWFKLNTGWTFFGRILRLCTKCDRRIVCTSLDITVVHCGAWRAWAVSNRASVTSKIRPNSFNPYLLA